MLIPRLLSFLLLITVSAGLAAAQSSPEKNRVALSTNSTEINSSGSIDLLSPGATPELTPLDRIRVDEYRPRLNQFGLPHALVLGPDGVAQEDTLCYSMRGYKVARENPQSDSTHAVGYSTCQPASRFRMHSAELRVLDPVSR
jgi:hypothetical protein